MIDVFVYGTLLVGESNHHVAAPYLLAVEPGTVRGRMVDCGEYPALILDPEAGEVPGEWFTVSEEGLRHMDILEQYEGPGGCNEYERVRVRDAYRDREGWIYVWENERGCPVIASGSWREHRGVRR